LANQVTVLGWVVGVWGGWNKEDEGEISADGTKVTKVLQNIEEELS
jgi:hypothetical protein